MMRRLIILAAIAFSACTHDLGGPLELETEKGNIEARHSLQAANFEDARDKYAAVLEADPKNVEAAFGYAVSDLLMLPSWEPIKDVLGRCHQPAFDTTREVFGPTGVLAREAMASAGTANIDAYFFPSAGAGASKLDFQPTSVKSEIYERTVGDARVKTLSITIYDARSSQGAWFSITVNPDDMTRNDGNDIVPLETGRVVDLNKLDGSVSISDPSRLQGASAFYASIAQLEGSITILQGGHAAGDTLAIQLDQLRIPTSCGEANCSASYGVSGMLVDTITERVDFDPAVVPFGDVNKDDGPPRRSDVVVAAERCSAITTDFIAAKAREVGDHFAEDGEKLAIVAGADPSFTFEIPKELLHARRDLVLNVTDARVGQAMVEIAAALLELAGQWRYVDGNVQDLIRPFTIWEDPLGMIQPEEIDVRDFEPSVVVENLARTLLTRAPELDLSKVRTRFDNGLASMARAIDDTSPAKVGIFDFSIPATRRLFTEISSLMSTLRSSLDAPDPVAWPEASLFRFHLRALFDTPLDRDRILERTHLPALVTLVPGDPVAMRAVDRNDRIDFAIVPLGDEVSRLFDDRGENVDLIEAWLGGAVVLPPDQTTTACTRSADCGPGYSCTMDQCVSDLPYTFTRGAWDQASRDNWPVFVNPGLRDAFGL